MKRVYLITIGAGMGGGGGMGGGMGSGIAGIIQGATGIGQMIAGAVKTSKAKSLMPAEVDPTQVGIVDTLRRLRTGYTTGSEAASYKNVVNAGLKTAANKAAAYSGGNTGTLLASLSANQDATGTAYNNIVASLEKNRMGALALENQAIDNVAQRRLDIKMAKYLQAMGEGTTLAKAGMQNFGASFNTFSGGTTQGDVTGGGDPTGGVNSGSVKAPSSGAGADNTPYQAPPSTVDTSKPTMNWTSMDSRFANPQR